MNPMEHEKNPAGIPTHQNGVKSRMIEAVLFVVILCWVRSSGFAVHPIHRWRAHSLRRPPKLMTKVGSIRRISAQRTFALHGTVVNRADESVQFNGNDGLKHGCMDAWEQRVNSFVQYIGNSTAPILDYQQFLKGLASYSKDLLNPFQIVAFHSIADVLLDTILPTVDDEGNAKEISESFINQTLQQLGSAHKTAVREMLSSSPFVTSQQSEQDMDRLYQFIGLISKTYDLLDQKTNPAYFLEEEQHSSTSTTLNAWTNPLINEVREQVPSFGVTSDVSSKIATLDANSVKRLLHNANIVGDFDTYPSPYDNLNSQSQSFMPGSTSTYAPAEFGGTLTRLLQFVCPVIKTPQIVERVTNMFQTKLSSHLRTVCSELEESYLNNQDKQGMEWIKLLKAGDLLVVAIITQWNVAASVVGEAVPFTFMRAGGGEDAIPTAAAVSTPASGGSDDSKGVQQQQNGVETIITKRYLLPLSLTSDVPTLLSGIPTHLQDEIETLHHLLQQEANSHPPVSKLTTPILLSHAMRTAAGAGFRSLITYTSSPRTWPQKRDEVYTKVLSDVVYTWLGCGSRDSNTTQPFLAALISLAALEEGMGIEEPRQASIMAYSRALIRYGRESVANSCRQQHQSKPAGVAHILPLVETALCHMSKLPEYEVEPAKIGAFETIVSDIISSQSRLRLRHALGDVDEESDGGAVVLPSQQEVGAEVDFTRLMVALKDLAVVFNLQPSNASAIMQVALISECESIFSKMVMNMVMYQAKDVDPDLVDIFEMRQRAMEDQLKSLMSTLSAPSEVQQRLVKVIAIALESMLSAAGQVLLQTMTTARQAGQSFGSDAVVLAEVDGLMSKAAVLINATVLGQLLGPATAQSSQSLAVDLRATVSKALVNFMIEQATSTTLASKESRISEINSYWPSMLKSLDALRQRYQAAGDAQARDLSSFLGGVIQGAKIRMMKLSSR